MSVKPLNREQLEYVCEHGVKHGEYFTRVGAVGNILATDAALRATLEEREKRILELKAQLRGLERYILDTLPLRS